MKQEEERILFSLSSLQIVELIKSTELRIKQHSHIIGNLLYECMSLHMARMTPRDRRNPV